MRTVSPPDSAAVKAVASPPTSAIVDPPAEPDVDPASIAVLPFVNMSEDPAQAYFSDGISEELLNVLAGMSDLQVASRTSAFAYKDSPLRLREIAAELKVAFILEGSVRKAGDRVRITAQLIDTRNDRHLWSDTFDRSLEDIFAIQTEIANAIGAALHEPLGLNIKPVEVTAATDDLDAYELYLKGREAWLGRQADQDLRDSIGYLERAVELDPDFIDALENLAAAYSIAVYWGISDRTADWYLQQVDALTSRVLATDPNRPLSISTRVDIMAPDPETGWGVRRDAYLRALEIDPGFVSGWHWLGLMMAEAGYLEAGVEHQEACLALEPNYYNCRVHRDVALMALGRRDEARANLEDLLLNVRGELWMEQFWIAWDLGDQPLAAAIVRGYEGLWPRAPWRIFFRALGNPDLDRARAIADWDRWAQQSGMVQWQLFDIFAALGAYERIDMSYSTGGFFWLPSFRDFRNSPEYKAQAKSSGLLTTWRHYGFPPQCRPLEGDDFECD